MPSVDQAFSFVYRPKSPRTRLLREFVGSEASAAAPPFLTIWVMCCVSPKASLPSTCSCNQAQDSTKRRKVVLPGEISLFRIPHRTCICMTLVLESVDRAKRAEAGCFPETETYLLALFLMLPLLACVPVCLITPLALTAQNKIQVMRTLL